MDKKYCYVILSQNGKKRKACSLWQIKMEHLVFTSTGTRTYIVD